MKKYSHLISLLIIAGSIYWSFYALMPQNYSKENTPPEKFSTERALIHVRNIARYPHYSSSPYHQEVQQYIVDEFKKLGLVADIQDGYVVNKWKRLSSPRNIVVRIKGSGNGDAVMLLSHYDSASHASPGASDAGSGVAAILEGVRAFNASGIQPKNDIIILISDNEELGLSGADLFVKKHPWAKDVKIVLNFEARGSGGPSYMLIETNGGNSKMINAFKKADVSYPAATSLAYSIYKMLPNDTDLTVFREDADINGYNFAFIDDHFDYHTARDTYENLDKNTMEHQGAYLMPMLNYLVNADLNDLRSMDDSVYFDTPLGFYSYPFMWIFPMVIIALLAFGYLLYLGFKTKRLAIKPVLAGFAMFIVILGVGTLVTYYGWEALLAIYPQYHEILHGFPYNGHRYIAAFIVFTLGICFLGYSWFKTRDHVASYTVAPLFIWFVINGGVAMYLKGAAFFIVPVYFGLLLFYILIKREKPNTAAMALLTLPMIFLLVPFLQAFPVGLGLDMLAACALFTVLIFGLMLPIFGFYSFKRSLAVLFFVLFGVFIIRAHFSSNFSEDRQKPNSLLYVLNADENTAQWATYDGVLDEWTKRKLGETPQNASVPDKNTAMRGYYNAFTYTADAPVKNVPVPKFERVKDTLIGDERHIELCMTSQRPINRIEVFTEEPDAITSMSANGEVVKNEGNKQSGQKLITYYPYGNNSYLEMHFVIPKGKNITLEINEISYDLLSNELFSVSPRSGDMIPKPFWVNDAIMLKKTIKL